MNFSSLLGVLSALAVFAAGVFTSTDNPMLYLNSHAIIIVLGGTAAAGLICFPLSQVLMLLKVFFRRVLGTNAPRYDQIIDDLVLLAKAARTGRGGLAQAASKVRHPFLGDCVQLLDWSDANISREHLRDVLETKAETHYRRYSKEARIFKTLAKFPPAFGLMGTTLGMITLLSSLGQEGAQNMIGPSMAIALVATLYGIVTANFVLIPIAENLSVQTDEDANVRRIIIEGIMMIHEGMPTQFVEEKCRAFLLPKDLGKKKAG